MSRRGRLTLLPALVGPVPAAVAVVVRLSADPPVVTPTETSPTPTPTPAPWPSIGSPTPAPTTTSPVLRPTAPAPPTLVPCPPGHSRPLSVPTSDIRARTDLDDQAAVLATMLGRFPAYGANVLGPPAESSADGREYGTLTLSRIPILDVDGAPVDVHHTHLRHTSGALRRDQVHAIRGVLEARDLPPVVGDHRDAEPDSPALPLLAPAGPTVPAGVPRRRIDFVRHDEWFVPRAAEDLLSAVSGHRTVGVRFELVDPRDCGAGDTS